MPKDSLKNLMDMFPWFFDKTVTSNFYKSQYITNCRFQDIYQGLFEVIESFHLNKRILVWKEQSEPYNYSLHFVANFPNLKSVKIFKESNVVYSEEFSSIDNVSSFDHVYSYDTRNDFSFVKSDDLEEDEIIIISSEEQSLLDNILFWRSDEFENQFNVNLNISLPHLKSVKLYKNDEVIYTNSYVDSSESSNIDYYYINHLANGGLEEENEENNTIDDVFYVEVETFNFSGKLTKYLPAIEPDCIPSSEFLIEVETYDEYFIRKGFPENDEYLDNDYDHDQSLDEIGALNNIPRKNYITTLDYDNTEPSYNNRLTEDDYHYMKRMLEYNLRLHTDYLPVVELWKLYGVDAVMENRERLIAKMFDITRHPYHSEIRKTTGGKEYTTLVVDDWTPEKWEHKDLLCSEKDQLGEYFFVSANTVQPIKRQPVYFTFNFLNSLAEKLTDEDYVVDIELIGSEFSIEGYSDSEWKCDAELLDEYEDNVFRFTGRRKDIIIGTVEIIITVRGCNTADIYVNPSSAGVTQKGTKEEPYSTLNQGIDAVTEVKNLIAIFGENHTTGKIPVHASCTLLGCNNATLINMDNYVFFKVKPLDPDIKITVQDISFETYHFNGHVETMSWTNENTTLDENAIAYNLRYGILIDDILPEKFVKNIQFNEFSGVVSWEEYDKSELLTLADFQGIIANLSLTDNFYFTESEIHEIEEKWLNNQFIFYEDRLDLANAVNQLTFNDNTGVLSFCEITEDEIVHSAKLHDILGVE